MVGRIDEDDDRLPESDNPDVGPQDRSIAGTGPTPPSAKLIHEIIRGDGEEELRRTPWALTWSAFGAGLSMGFSFLVMAILRSRLPDAPWAELVYSFGYTTGFLIVVLGRQQLFTESTLTAILPLLTRRDLRTSRKVARLWAIVLVANVCGAFFFAWLVSHQGLFDARINKSLAFLADEAMTESFWPMFTKAILAGWLIALMVWLIPGAGQARLWLILLITYTVSVAHFSHIIAGSVEAFYNLITGHIGLRAYFTLFAFPTLLGNTIGGVSLVAILNHAPVRGEMARDKERKGRPAYGHNVPQEAH